MSSKTNNRRAPTNGKPEEPTVQSNVLKVSEIEEKERKQRSAGEKIAGLIAAFCGSMVFVYVHVVWFGAWIVINSMISNLAFDPFPYTFLTLVVSLEAIFLSTFILISQNHETRLTERRNHLDLQINLLAEQESTKTLELLRKMATQMGIPCEDLDDLAEPVDPEELIEKISSAADEGSPVRK